MPMEKMNRQTNLQIQTLPIIHPNWTAQMNHCCSFLGDFPYPFTVYIQLIRINQECLHIWYPTKNTSNKYILSQGNLVEKTSDIGTFTDLWESEKQELCHAACFFHGDMCHVHTFMFHKQSFVPHRFVFHTLSPKEICHISSAKHHGNKCIAPREQKALQMTWLPRVNVTCTLEPPGTLHFLPKRTMF